MNKSDLKRDLYMLRGPLSRHGYDWWWHNFTAYKRSTGEPRSFFIEYYVCNPALGSETPILGQLPENRINGKKPSYAMIKAGYWGKGARQIHNFYGIREFASDPGRLGIKIGGCTLSEEAIKGSCSLTREEAESRPELMSGYGEMSWDLKVDKRIAYHVGYGASPFLRSLNVFEMFWHAEGIKTRYSGEVILDGEAYDVLPDTSYGYADKNWGSNFTSPWLWLSSCDLRSLVTGKRLEDSALEFGGGNPKVFGLSLGRKLLGGFHYEGTTYDYNFSKFWSGVNIGFAFAEGGKTNEWKITARNRKSKVEVAVTCGREDMLFVNYESPDGKKRHNRLWNGGTGAGEMKFYLRRKRGWELIDHIAIASAGCEYGEYGPPAEN